MGECCRDLAEVLSSELYANTEEYHEVANSEELVTDPRFQIWSR
jgi:hypothetical protein